MQGGNYPLQIAYSGTVTVENNFNFGRDGNYNTLLYYNYDNDENGTTKRDSNVFNNNRYYYLNNRSTYLGGLNWTDWQNETNVNDASISFERPTGSEDTYFLSRADNGEWASLVIYDFSKTNSVNIDLSPVISNGSEYYIYDIQNIDGAPVASGTYSGGNVAVPTNLTEVTQPYGDLHPTVVDPVTHTDQDFNVFIVKATAFEQVQEPEPEPENTVRTKPKLRCRGLFR
jgi:hypothetical protein